MIVSSVKQLPKYARERYFAIARTLANKPFGITRKEAADMVKLFLQSLQVDKADDYLDGYFEKVSVRCFPN